ncbi:MAG: aminotransferase class IV [Bacteroidetes bacterium]|jgi:branched-chain amino acid aminotransferase|nr:aminotransferase class IV [Bacteroidota bacterium]
MDSCLHAYFVQNKELISSCDFNVEKLDNQGYVYEVVRVMQAVPLFLEDHLKRMYNSLALANSEPKVSSDFVRNSLLKLISFNKVDYGNIKIIIGNPQDAHKPFYAAWFQPHFYPSDANYEQGVKVAFLEHERPDPNAKIWHTNYQELVRETKLRQGVFELLLSNDGKVTEGSKSNIFLIKDQAIYTPPELEVLNGITRQKVILLANQNNIHLVEKSVRKADIAAADALFLSGTSPKILPVSMILPDKQFQTDHPLLRKMIGLYDALIENYIDENKPQQ